MGTNHEKKEAMFIHRLKYPEKFEIKIKESNGPFKKIFLYQIDPSSAKNLPSDKIYGLL